MTEAKINEAITKMKEAENGIIRLEAQKESALTSLKNDYGISSIEEGDTLLAKKDAELTTIEKELASTTKVLEEEFPWE